MSTGIRVDAPIRQLRRGSALLFPASDYWPLEPRARRKPRSAFWREGESPLRDADRLCTAQMIQLPPRCERSEPVSGPWGSSVSELA